MVSTEGHASDRYTEVGPYRLRYWEAGSGPPLLLVHGLGTAAELWQENISHLSQHFRVLVPDLPGFGLTSKPETGYSVATGIWFLARFLAERRAAPANLVGNSMGGLLAAHFALEHPHMVRRLVLADPAGLGRDLGLMLRLLSVPGLGELMAVPTVPSLRWAFGSLFHDRRRLSEGLVHAICRQRRLPGARRALLQATRHGVDLKGQRREIMLDRLHELCVPTLIIWGREDRLIPVRHAYAARQAIPDCELYIFEQCGHVPMLEWPDQFNRLVIDFLSQGAEYDTAA